MTAGPLTPSAPPPPLASDAPPPLPPLSMPPCTRPAPLLTVVTPAHNEEENLPLLHERLCAVLDEAKITWEWIVVDDQSTDGTFGVLAQLAEKDARVRGLRFSRNFGSHTAIACGLHHARGSAATVMAADLQDPPEELPALLEKWRAGNHVVWAVRKKREGEKKSSLGFSSFYYFIMRRFVGMRDMPATGADFFLIDRRVIQAFSGFRETNTSIFALITWMGFKQTTVDYTKRGRNAGQSSWTFEKKLKLVVDSITSFTYLPIRLMSYVGFAVAFGAMCYIVVVIVNAFRGQPASGWSSLMSVVLLTSGVQMTMMGVLGEYVWRTLDESRSRPRYLIEATTDPFTSPAEPAPRNEPALRDENR